MADANDAIIAAVKAHLDAYEPKAAGDALDALLADASVLIRGWHGVQACQIGIS